MRVMHWFFDSLRQHVELALFFTLALGHALGRLRLGTFTPGPVLGALVAGVIVGQLGIAVPEALKNALFLLFLFSIGYQTGPLFFRGLKSTGLPQIGLTLFLCCTALATAWGVSSALGLDAGSAGGLVAGAMTSAAALGTAGDALGNLGVDLAVLQDLMISRTVAFAVTYLVGMGLVVWLLARLAPRILGVDLAAECRRLEEEMGVKRTETGIGSAYAELAARAYEIPAGLAGRSVAELEAMFPGVRVFVERVRHAGRLRDDFTPQFRLPAGDRVALTGPSQVLADGRQPLMAHEVDDRELLDIPVVTLEAVLTSREFASRTLAELAVLPWARGVFLRRLTRAGTELPFTPATMVERGDVLRITGARRRVAAAAEQLGFAEWPTSATDMTTVSVAILLGGLAGLPALQFGKVALGLSMFVGVLLGGLVFGWLRSRYRSFGHVPEAALWVFDSLGLTGFLALVGIEAGPDFIRGLADSGLMLVAAGVVVTSVPHIATLLVGKYLLKLHPGILIGVCCGAGTSAPALAAVQEVADSRIPALGYGVGCALGNVMLALWGGVLVILTGL